MYHDHTIYSMVETLGLQILYQQDYDKFYRAEEKRYITLNDKSGWQRIEADLKSKDKYKIKRIH